MPMPPSTITSNLQTGGIQYQTALKNAQNASKSMMLQAGLTGNTDAFVPQDYAVTGTTAPTAASFNGLSYGPQGAYSEAYQAGGNIAAEQASASRSRGLGGGGLAAQRQELATMQTQSGAANVTAGLVQGLGDQLSSVEQAGATEKQRIVDANLKAAEDAAKVSTGYQATPEVAAATPTTNAATTLAPNSVGAPVKVTNLANYKVKGNPTGDKKPTNPKPGQSFKSSGGVTFVWRTGGPAGAGWYRKGK